MCHIGTYTILRLLFWHGNHLLFPIGFGDNVVVQYAKMLTFRRNIEKLGMATAEIARTLGSFDVNYQPLDNQGSMIKAGIISHSVQQCPQRPYP